MLPSSSKPLITTVKLLATIHWFLWFPGTNTESVLDLTAEAASEAVLSDPDIYNVILAAYTETVLGQLTINSTGSVQIASNALAALRSAQQPAMVQVKHIEHKLFVLCT